MLVICGLAWCFVGFDVGVFWVYLVVNVHGLLQLFVVWSGRLLLGCGLRWLVCV